MKTIGDADVLQSLKTRLSALRPESQRRWGTLTPHEVVCHLGDATEMVTLARPRTVAVPLSNRPLVKLIVLWSPLPWPRGRPTNPMHNPHDLGTRPSDFSRDLARLLAAMDVLATAPEGSLEPAHGFFGTMSTRDWQRWAYRHTEHHLKQFGI